VFQNVVRGVLTRLVASQSRVRAETASASKARAGALRLLRAHVTAAIRRREPLVLPEAMHAVWEHMERAGGDAPVSVLMSETKQAEVAQACADYYGAYLARSSNSSQSRSPGGRARPPAEYVALALLYHTPTMPSDAQSNLRTFLPDVKKLKSYGFNVHKFTNAQRFIKETALAAQLGAAAACAARAATAASRPSPILESAASRKRPRPKGSDTTYESSDVCF